MCGCVYVDILAVMSVSRECTLGKRSPLKGLSVDDCIPCVLGGFNPEHKLCINL